MKKHFMIKFNCPVFWGSYSLSLYSLFTLFKLKTTRGGVKKINIKTLVNERFKKIKSI